MPDTKHTPGPWIMSGSRQRVGDDNKSTWHTVGPDGNWIAAVPYSDRTTLDHIRSLADARLIAAAPDLLAVAQMVLDTASDTTPPELLAAATAAIAKAEGR